MSTLWDDTPSSLKSGGALDSLEPVLNGVDTPTQTERVEDDGFTWRVWTTTAGGQRPLSVDPANGTFSTGTAAARSTSTPLVFPDPRVGIEFALRLDSAGEPDGTVRLIVKSPKAFVRVPFLRGAFLDAQGRAPTRRQPPGRHVPPPRHRRPMAAPRGRKRRLRAQEQHAGGPHPAGPDLRFHLDGAGARARSAPARSSGSRSAARFSTSPARPAQAGFPPMRAPNPPSGRGCIYLRFASSSPRRAWRAWPVAPGSGTSGSGSERTPG